MLASSKLSSNLFRFGLISGVFLLVGYLYFNKEEKTPISDPNDLNQLNIEARTIFAHHCYSCHGEVKSKGGLQLHTKAAAFAAEPVEEPVSGPFPVAAAKDEAPSTASPAADASGATSVEPPSDVPDYAIVREAVLRLAVVKTPEITRALLDTYGVRKAADLDPSRWAALLADVNAAMA